MEVTLKKILIIEDDHTIGEVEKDYFELAGFDVTLSDNGKKGLDLALTDSFDLYILDVMLPGVNGFEIAKQIRETKDTPIVMVTAKSEEIDKVRGFSLRIDDYVTKPFSPAELVARAKAHLKRYEALKSYSADEIKETLKIRGLLIDIGNRQVFMNGSELDLTRKEYELLVLLASTANKIFTKEEIFQKVLGNYSAQCIQSL